METTIKMKLSTDKMNEIFNSSLVNIKYFKAVTEIGNPRYFNYQEPIFFNITIRHNEDQKPKKLMTDAIKCKSFNIESRITRIECISITANTRKEAIKIAEENKSLNWEIVQEEERQLVSIG
jgi:hypothetical protein